MDISGSRVGKSHVIHYVVSSDEVYKRCLGMCLGMCLFCGVNIRFEEIAHFLLEREMCARSDKALITILPCLLSSILSQQASI